VPEELDLDLGDGRGRGDQLFDVLVGSAVDLQPVEQVACKTTYIMLRPSYSMLRPSYIEGAQAWDIRSLGFPDFCAIKSSWVGDLVVKILTYYFNF
jgi:hypothetical protein